MKYEVQFARDYTGRRPVVKLENGLTALLDSGAYINV